MTTKTMRCLGTELERAQSNRCLTGTGVEHRVPIAGEAPRMRAPG
jgi:hypothetical protein